MCLSVYVFIGEVIKAKAKKIKARVYVNEYDFLSHIKPPTR
jgi:hypothetical protein